jgi:tripartite-type tricarboxylate transporter receptor subunit TctC
MLRKMITAAAILTTIAFNTQAAWPENPVNLVVPYPAGAGVDPVARLVGQKLSEKWGQPVVVQNKPGASGSIGATSVARSKPDGYTIMMSATAEVVINQFIMDKMAYDPEKDLTPVTLAVRLPFILVANPAAPFSTIPELVAYAKKHPGQVTYASSGNGTPQHLAGVLLQKQADVEMSHIPYKGVAPSLTALLGNEVSIGFAGLPAGQPHVQSGKLKALGLSSKNRSTAAPDVASISEAPGLENFEFKQILPRFCKTQSCAKRSSAKGQNLAA